MQFTCWLCLWAFSSNSVQESLLWRQLALTISHTGLGVWVALGFKTILSYSRGIVRSGTSCLRKKKQTILMPSAVSLKNGVDWVDDAKDPVEMKPWFFCVPRVNWELAVSCMVSRCILSSRRQQQQVSLTLKMPVTAFTLMLLRQSPTIWWFSTEAKGRLEDFFDCIKKMLC